MSENNISDAERVKLFGKFDWKRTNGDFVDIDDKWEKENITTIYIPQLKGINTDGGKSSGKIQFNVKVVDQMIAAWKEVEAQDLLKYVLTWDGSFVPRVKRNGNTLSNHAYGTAFDINAEFNWLGDTPAKNGQKGDLHLLVPIFKTHGFFWGGDWASPKDGMHFEAGRIVSYDKDDSSKSIETDLEPKLIIDDNWRSALKLNLIAGQSYVSAKGLADYFGQKFEGTDKVVPAGQALASYGYKYKWNNEQKKLYAFK